MKNVTTYQQHAHIYYFLLSYEGRYLIEDTHITLSL